MTTKVSHARFYGLLAKLPYLSKKDVVWQYSGMLTDSLSTFHDYNPQGYNMMIRALQEMVDSTEKYKRSDPVEELSRLKKLRSGILKRIQKHGIDTTDWDKVNAFMEQKRIAGKRLYAMTIPEMEALIPKMESILKKDKALIEEHNRLAHWN